MGVIVRKAYKYVKSHEKHTHGIRLQGINAVYLEVFCLDVHILV